MSIPNLYQNNEVYTVHTYPSREEWLNGRSKGIGGSSASACLNHNPYMTSGQLYRIKKGIEIAEDISNKPYVKYGNEAEDPLRKLFSLNYPRYDVQYMGNTLLRSVGNPMLYYSPDGLLFDKQTGRKGILEIKTSSILRAQHRERWDNGVPMNYYIQCIHGLNVTGFDFVVVWAELKWEFENGDILLKTSPHDINREDKQEDIEFVKQGVLDWWHKYYIPGIEPPLEISL